MGEKRINIEKQTQITVGSLLFNFFFHFVFILSFYFFFFINSVLWKQLLVDKERDRVDVRKKRRVN